VEQAKSIAVQAKGALASGTVSEPTFTSIVTATSATTLSAAGLISAGADGLFISVSGGGSVALSGGATIAQAVAAVTAADSGLTLTFDDATDKLSLTATAGSTVTVGVIDGSSFTPFGAVTGTATTGGTGILYGTAGGASVASLQTDYNKVLTSITDLVGNGDTAYKGINLLKSTNLTVNLSENSSQLAITGVDATLTGLGLSTAAWTDGTAVETSITQTDTAVSNLRNFASSFGTDLSILQYRESRSEERRVGKECRCGWSPESLTKQKRTSMKRRSNDEQWD